VLDEYFLLGDVGEGGGAGEHEEEREAERVNVASGVYIVESLGLFGGHVAAASESGAALVEFAFVHVMYARESEVAQFRLAAFGDHDVAGFDVTVKDACVVGEFEGFGDLAYEADAFKFGEGAVFFDHSRDGGAVDVFHGEVVPAVGLADIEGGDKVLVSDTGGGAALALEPLDEFFAHVAADEHLEGDGAFHSELFGEIDDAHSAAADLADDLVSADAERAAPPDRVADELLDELAREEAQFVCENGDGAMDAAVFEGGLGAHDLVELSVGEAFLGEGLPEEFAIEFCSSKGHGAYRSFS